MNMILSPDKRGHVLSRWWLAMPECNYTVPAGTGDYREYAEMFTGGN